MPLTSQINLTTGSGAETNFAAAGQATNSAANTKVSTGLTAGARVFVAPFYTNLDSSITAAVNVVQNETVEIEYDDMYTITLTDASSAAILGAFKLSGNGNTFDVSGRSVGAQIAFTDAVKKVLYDASLNSGAVTGGSLQQNMYNATWNDMKAVYGDLIANILESNWYVNVSLDVPKGAKDLCDNLFTVAPTNKGYIQIIGDQIPNSNYMAYSDVSENLVTDALPLLGGDSLVFVFNVDSKVNSYHVSQRAPLVDKDGLNLVGVSAASVLGGAAPTKNATASTPKNVKGKTSRVAFKITFSSTDGSDKPIRSILPNGTALPATLPAPASGAAKWGLTVGANGYAPAVMYNLIDPAQTGATVSAATGNDAAAFGPAPTPNM
jgi:hypothetical protein